jgi:trigger factor
MSTKVSLETLDGCRRALRVEVPPERLAPRVEATLQELGRNVRLPGFRPGKAPRALLERRFRDHVREEVLRQAIPEHYAEALKEAAVAPVGPPTVDEVTWNEGEPLRFRAVVEVRPSIAVKDYLGVALAREKIQVEDAELNRALELLREEAATYTPMAGWPALQDDLVVIDHEGTLHGKPFKGGSAQNVNVILGAGRYLPGFEEALRGMAKGEGKEFDVEFPADYPRKDLAGRKARFRVTVREVKKKRVPELNDELAKELGEADTLAGLRDKVRERLAARKARDQEAELKGRILEKIAEANPVDLPEALVLQETQNLLQGLAQTLGAGLQRAREEDLAVLQRQAEEEGRRRVRTSLLLEAIARQEGLTVGEDELQAEVAQMASALRQDAAGVRRALEADGRLDGIRGRLLERKALDLVWSRARLTDTMNLVQLA